MTQVFETYKASLFASCALKQLFGLFNAQAMGMTLYDALYRDVKFILDDLTDEEAERIKFEASASPSKALN